MTYLEQSLSIYGNKVAGSSAMTRYLKLKDLEIYMVVMMVKVVVTVVSVLLGNMEGKKWKSPQKL